MDIQVAAVIYDVEFRVVTYNRRRKCAYIEDIHAFHRNRRRSTSSSYLPRIVWYDGRGHFRVGHPLPFDY